MLPCQSTLPLLYNSILKEQNIRSALYYFGIYAIGFDSAKFMYNISNIPDFPVVSISQMLESANKSGIKVSGFFLEFNELLNIKIPCLVYLQSNNDGNKRLDLTVISAIDNSYIHILNNMREEVPITHDDFCKKWTGIALIVERHSDGKIINKDLFDYKLDITLTSSMLSKKECIDVIHQSELLSFDKSKIAKRGIDAQIGDVNLSIRDSSSVALSRTSSSLINSIYARCAELACVDVTRIETLQCVRYNDSQMFKPHFDAGINLSRMTTLLIYLNDDFEGGYTWFPIVDLFIKPVAGSCLQFKSCDIHGRIFWQSEHSGTPVHSGTKYAINAWIKSI